MVARLCIIVFVERVHTTTLNKLNIQTLVYSLSFYFFLVYVG